MRISPRISPVAFLLLAGLLLLAPPSRGQAPAPASDEILGLYRDGKKDQALDVAQTVLKSTPNDMGALYIAARVLQEQGRIDDAIPVAQALNRHHPGLAAGWEISTQLYQVAGRLADRDTALRQLINTQAASLDRATRQRRFVVRDRIVAHGRTVLAQEHADTGAPDSVRYVFIPENEPAQPRNYLILMTDGATTETWRENGFLPPGKRLFHLDSVYQTPTGGQASAVYATWTDPPDYDSLRAKVLEVMSGTAKPLSGKPGGLAIPATTGGG